MTGTDNPRTIGLRFLLAAAVAATVLGIGAPTRADSSIPSGRFVVVDLRAASDVAASAAARQTDLERARLGGEILFGRRVRWADGRYCEVRPAEESGSLAREDRNLSDLQIVPGKTDRRLNRSLIVECSRGSMNDAWQVLIVDDRVLVARSGGSTTYLVLEKPIARGDALRLRRGLRRAGLDPGSTAGVIDARARAAVATYARQHGAAYRFATGIVTRNVLDSLSEAR